MFYPAGDEPLARPGDDLEPGLRVIVNTRLLYDHLLDTGCQSMREAGTWFEPAFPESAYFFEPDRSSPLNFFFYARPNNPRNLFCRGVEAINKAATSGVLRPKDWRFHFVGKDSANKPGAGNEIVTPQGLTWNCSRCPNTSHGSRLIADLHATSELSTLDLAASGAVAVTNLFGSKASLSSYSKNIVCADFSVDGLVEGLAKGQSLPEMQSYALRTTRLRRCPDPEESFAGPLRWLDGG